MKFAKIRILFKDGSIGWYVDDSHISSYEGHARTFSLAYAQGLVKGLNLGIQLYGDELTQEAQVVMY